MTDRLEHRAALPIGYGLHEYRLTGVLGHGGFGITYSAFDAALGKTVAVKEYLPGAFAVRDGAVEVAPRSADDAEPFHWGLERFLEEARILALFHHPNVVGVHRYFEANGTAYMVMEYVEGQTLAQAFRAGRTFDAAALAALAHPLLDGLEAVHRAGYLHRDIKPSNIVLRDVDRPVLLDFGSARSALGRGSRTVTSIVTPGYAPYEQYYSNGNQGPWTDIYALAAILHQIVAGQPPVEAPARVKNDPLVPARIAGEGRYPAAMLDAIDWGLAFDETARPQCVADWRAALLADARRPQGLSAVRADDRIVARRAVAPARGRRGLLVVASVVGLLLASAAGYGTLEYREMQEMAAHEAALRVQARVEAEHAAEIQASALAREIEAREDAERLRRANEAAAAKALLEERQRQAAAAAAAREAEIERERQAEAARRQEAEAAARRKAAEAELEAAEQARYEAERAAREELARRSAPVAAPPGPVFGRTVTRDQIGRPRVITGPVASPPVATPPFQGGLSSERERAERDEYVRRLAQQEFERRQQLEADEAERRAEERARARAEREQLQRDLEERRQRQQDELRAREIQRQREQR